MLTNAGIAHGFGWMVGSPPCIVVHGRRRAGRRRHGNKMWFNSTVEFINRAPWVMSTLHTGLSIEHQLFCFRDPQAAIRVAEYIATIAPLLDVPLYSKDISAIHEAVRVTDGAFMQAIHDYIVQLAPELRAEEGIRLYEESPGWRGEFVKYLRRSL